MSAGALAGRFGVSRQVIVGDVALLRAGGAAVTATARGYVAERERTGTVGRVACRHGAGDMERELRIMVDNGCTVVDVIVTVISMDCHKVAEVEIAASPAGNL